MSTPEIVYRESIGGGNDTEGIRPDGIVVTLSFFNSDNFRAPDHYLLTSEVMIGHVIIVDELEVIRSYIRTDPQQIRKAIALFDQLVELNPEIKNEINQ